MVDQTFVPKLSDQGPALAEGEMGGLDALDAILCCVVHRHLHDDGLRRRVDR